jgi:hypothetical protein
MPSTLDSGLGPLSFTLDLSDRYDTLDPQAPLEGLTVAVGVPIGVPWNLERTDLTNAPVTSSPALWTQAGAGPHDVFADQLGVSGRKKIGTIEWSLTTKVERWVQREGARFRQVVTVTPVLLLTRRTIGTSVPEIEVRETRPTPCYGAWQPLPPALRET